MHETTITTAINGRSKYHFLCALFCLAASRNPKLVVVIGYKLSGILCQSDNTERSNLTSCLLSCIAIAFSSKLFQLCVNEAKLRLTRCR